MASVPPTLLQVASRVEARLAALIDEERARWVALDSELDAPFASLRSLVLSGGKRLRPAFCYWGFVGAGGDPEDTRVVDAGAAFELLHAFALFHDDVAKTLTSVNRIVAERVMRGMFVTFLYAVLDPATGEVVYGNAGHLAPIVRHADGKLTRWEDSGGPPLGILPDVVYPAHAKHIDKGEVLMLLSDGIGKGDRVAFLDKNVPEFFELLLGAAKIGAVMVAVNWRLAPAEVAHIVNDAQARLLVVGTEFLPVLEKIEGDVVTTRRVLVVGDAPSRDSWDAWRDAHPADDPMIEDIKRKSFTGSVMLTRKQVTSPHLRKTFVEGCRTLAPLMRFLSASAGVPW